MTEQVFLLVIAALWIAGSLHGSILAARLLRAALGDEEHRTKNGLRKIISIGVIRRFRLTFVVMLLSLFGSVVSILHAPGFETRVVNTLIFIAVAGVLVVKLNREARDRRNVMGYALREDRITPRVRK